uniref:Uncharacterized protein n=1 Tax=Gouania willdenowi TaxID=441366 RepID=A0A8C5HTH9_GOUWI
MNLLLRLLFLFQSLPVFVPQSAFKLLEKLLSKCIWQNKRPRVHLKILMSDKENGGLRLPNIKMYYWAAQIRAIVAWIIGDPETMWVSVEEESVPGISLFSLPFIGLETQKKMKIENVWIKHTLKVWNQVQKQSRGVVALSRAMSIRRNIEFLPSLADSGFDRWPESKLITVNQLFEGNVVKTFAQLRNNFNLPSKDHYRCLQIRNYLTKHKDWDQLRREPTNIENHFIHLSENSGVMKKQVSLIYHKLLMDVSDNTQNIKQQWEMELNVILDDDTWGNVCPDCHKGVGSQMWKEFDWKTKIRFFRTPLESFCCGSWGSGMCWRNCGLVGDQTHISWDCPILHHFLTEVKGLIDKLLKANLTYSLMICPKITGFYCISC